ncbi:hypothetical protein HYW82_00780 [Candidatus Peregrinibacteria bacterium]|nr:hypothetical protein [Candidatus Peregrinibacteria bacterium]
MDKEQKKAFAIGIFAFTVIAIGVIFFLFGDRILRGKLEITAETPYSVEIFDGGIYKCLSTPCVMDLSYGTKDLLLKKADHKTIIAEAKIGIWKTEKLAFEFEINPQITRAESLPETLPKKEYRLVEAKNGMQKLIEAGDDRGLAIVYFNPPLKNSRIIAGEKTALIMEDTAVYKIDLEKKSREIVENREFLDIVEGNWSPDGHYLVFTRKGLPNLWLFDGLKVFETDLNIGLNQTAWAYDNSLVFVTEQGAGTAVESGKYGNSYINILAEKSPAGFIFGFYHPDENSYTKIDTFGEIPSLPQGLIPSATGHIIYFQAAGENFKIILRKF